MKTLITFATATTLAVLLLVPAIRAEDDATPEKAETKSAAELAAEKAEIAKHVRALGSTEFEERDAAYEALRALGARAEPALKKALESDDLQIKISAERLLAEMRSRSGSGAKRSPLAEAEDDWSSRRLEELVRRMVESGATEMTAEELEAFRRAIELQQRSMTERLTKLREDAERRLGGFRDFGLTLDESGSTGKVLVRTNDETLSYEQAADGKVKVSITKDGEKAKEYEAESLDALKKTHPEVYERVKGFTSDGGRVTLRIGPFTGGGEPRFPRGTPTPRAEFGASVPGRLGVHVGSVTPVLRAQLGLEEGVGLVVERVVADSIAFRCGVKPWDVVVAVDGRIVGSAVDVRTALEAHGAETPVKVTVVRGGKRMELVEAK